MLNNQILFLNNIRLVNNILRFLLRMEYFESSCVLFSKIPEKNSNKEKND
jgi:hypothetical protein